MWQHILHFLHTDFSCIFFTHHRMNHLSFQLIKLHDDIERQFSEQALSNCRMCIRCVVANKSVVN
jgi:hypothetical protein